MYSLMYQTNSSVLRIAFALNYYSAKLSSEHLNLNVVI